LGKDQWPAKKRVVLEKLNTLFGGAAWERFEREMILPHLPTCVFRLPCSSLCYQSSNDEPMLSQGRVTNMIRGPGEGGITS